MLAQSTFPAREPVLAGTELGSPSATTAAHLDVNATLDAAARYSYGDDRKALHALQQLVLYANSLAGNDLQGFRGALADRMAALLTSPEATPAAKVFVCGHSPLSPPRSRPRR